WQNTITYRYKRINYGSADPLFLQGAEEMVLQNINYTGHEDDAGDFNIGFHTSGNRMDSRVSLKTGKKIANAQKLDAIRIYQDITEFKRYEFTYKPGQFNKTLLDSVKEFRGNQFFYAHGFEYYNQGLTYSGTPQELDFSMM